MLGGLARELGSWQLGPQLAWAYLHTDEHLAQLAEQLTALAPPQLELQLLAEAGDSRQLDLGSAGAGGVAGGVVQQLTASLGEYSARHCPDTRYQDISTVYLSTYLYPGRWWRVWTSSEFTSPHTARRRCSSSPCLATTCCASTPGGGSYLQYLGMSIISTNISTICRDSDSFSVFEEEDDSPLYILAGEWVAGRLLLYEDPAPAPAPATSASSGRCLNSSEDAAAQLAASLQARERVRSSNLETLWGR